MEVNVGGRTFRIGHEFLEEYPDSVLAKSLAVCGKDESCFHIDRDGDLFAQILDFFQDQRLIEFSQLSHNAIEKLLIEARYFIIEPLIDRCIEELDIDAQSKIKVAPNERELKGMLVGESRLVMIIHISDITQISDKQIEEALKLVNRDKCLIVGCKGLVNNILCEYCLYDPKKDQMLFTYSKSTRSNLYAMMYYIESLNPRALVGEPDWDRINANLPGDREIPEGIV